MHADLRCTFCGGDGHLAKDCKMAEHLRKLEHTKADSSNITSTAYHAGTSTLVVTFSSGKQYAYKGVTQEEMDALLEAPSIGAHFAAVIRSRHKGLPL
ncbi:MAG: KTSC domain-containing protein [Burkholderiales bacterium]